MIQRRGFLGMLAGMGAALAAKPALAKAETAKAMPVMVEPPQELPGLPYERVVRLNGEVVRCLDYEIIDEVDRVGPGRGYANQRRSRFRCRTYGVPLVSDPEAIYEIEVVRPDGSRHVTRAGLVAHHVTFEPDAPVVDSCEFVGNGWFLVMP